MTTFSVRRQKICAWDGKMSEKFRVSSKLVREKEYVITREKSGTCIPSAAQMGPK